MDEKMHKKINRKLKRCQDILLKNQNVKTIPEPSNSLFVGNGGFGCGFTREQLAEIFGSIGTLEAIVLLPGQPYSFVTFHETAEAIEAMRAVCGRKLETGHTLYMAYIDSRDVPLQQAASLQWPGGLVLIEDFVSEEEEAILLAAVSCEDEPGEKKSLLKHRRVYHFGYEFSYESNCVDCSRPLPQGIPPACMPHLRRLVALGHISRMPDQLTVNYYLPGQGIPSHIDTHSAFEDGIVSLSLASQVMMEFSRPGEEEGSSVSVLLPRRSVLIMCGESRYLWKHGITPRRTDIVPSKDGQENQPTLHHRSTRVSLTFRIARDGECQCEYKNQCDSQQKVKSSAEDFVSNEEAEKLEKKYVNQVYEAIAHHFSATRYKPWPRVAHFLSSVAPGSVVLDVGCGNGKNMHLSRECYEIGCDASPGLARVCLDRGMEVLVADCLRLPFRDGCADALICIAVIHHMANRERRCKAIRELLRVLRPAGRALVYVWAFEQEDESGQPSKYLKKEDPTSPTPPPSVLEVGPGSCLPVHCNKTDFRTQDVLVPWKKNTSEDVCHRFYHVFAEGELEETVEKGGGKVVEAYYDEGNWCAVVTK